MVRSGIAGVSDLPSQRWPSARSDLWRRCQALGCAAGPSAIGRLPVGTRWLLPVVLAAVMVSPTGGGQQHSGESKDRPSGTRKGVNLGRPRFGRPGAGSSLPPPVTHIRRPARNPISLPHEPCPGGPRSTARTAFSHTPRKEHSRSGHTRISTHFAPLVAALQVHVFYARMPRSRYHRFKL